MICYPSLVYVGQLLGETLSKEDALDVLRVHFKTTSNGSAKGIIETPINGTIWGFRFWWWYEAGFPTGKLGAKVYDRMGIDLTQDAMSAGVLRTINNASQFEVYPADAATRKHILVTSGQHQLDVSKVGFVNPEGYGYLDILFYPHFTHRVRREM